PSPNFQTKIQVSSNFLRTEDQAGSFLAFDHPVQVTSEPCPPSNELSRKYLQPVLHTIIPHSSHNPGSELLKINLQVSNPWRSLPPLNSSCVTLPDTASLIPLAVQLPLPVRGREASEQAERQKFK
ncbi:hypothetical protein ILYODFUR_035334, partial [Ilyodon furcidens]